VDGVRSFQEAMARPQHSSRFDDLDGNRNEFHKPLVVVRQQGLSIIAQRPDPTLKAT
jgi:hypothetical protein